MKIGNEKNGDFDDDRNKDALKTSHEIGWTDVRRCNSCMCVKTLHDGITQDT